MRQSLVPVLLLAAVAFSSSNILPVMTNNQLKLNTIGIDGQLNDNILSNRFNTDVLNNIFYTAPFGTSQSNRLLKKYTEYDKNNNQDDDVDIVKEDNYDDEGFRKEQWHNYPRQLDRLHNYLFEHQNVKKHIPEADDNDNGNVNDESGVTKRKINDEYLVNNNDDVHDMYDANVAANPLLILKIHLEFLSNRVKNSKFNNLQRIESENDDTENDENLLTNEINSAMKFKREDAIQGIRISDNTAAKRNKRLFSLWSRLQSLSHRGHQLPHRRHFAFYGVQNSEEGRDLTAETRATLMRPPGSPLRWG